MNTDYLHALNNAFNQIFINGLENEEKRINQNACESTHPGSNESHEPTKEQILRGECERIHVTGWDEAEKYLETQKDFHFLSYDEWETYWNNRFYCTTTEDGFLPL